jgi:hypothetical protein
VENLLRASLRRRQSHGSSAAHRPYAQRRAPGSAPKDGGRLPPVTATISQGFLKAKAALARIGGRANHAPNIRRQARQLRAAPSALTGEAIRRSARCAFDPRPFGWSRLGTALLLAVISMLGGVAFGLVFLSSALAIVVYFVLPTVWAILGETIPGLERVAPWLDTSGTTTKLSEDAMTSGDWPRLATGLALWLVLPLVIGLWRVRRSEVK